MDTITAEMNAGEAVAVMDAIAFYLTHLAQQPRTPETIQEQADLYTFVARVRPHITQKAAEARRSERDGRN